MSVSVIRARRADEGFLLRDDLSVGIAVVVALLKTDGQLPVNVDEFLIAIVDEPQMDVRDVQGLHRLAQPLDAYECGFLVPFVGYSHCPRSF